MQQERARQESGDPGGSTSVAPIVQPNAGPERPQKTNDNLRPPAISAIMALHNRVDLMDASIKSILDQDEPDFELIVIDDASSDGSWESAQRWAKSDSRIRLDRFATNRGISAVRNRGVELARGRYLATCDSDDLARPQRFRLQREALDADSGVVGVGGQLWCFVGDPAIDGWLPHWHFGLRDGRQPFSFAGGMLRTEAVRQFGYDPTLRVAEDLDLAYKLSTVGTFVDLPDIVIDYRIHSGGISSKNRTLEWDNLRAQLRGLRLLNGRFSLRGYLVLGQSLLRATAATLGFGARKQRQARIARSGGGQTGARTPGDFPDSPS